MSASRCSFAPFALCMGCESSCWPYNGNLIYCIPLLPFSLHPQNINAHVCDTAPLICLENAILFHGCWNSHEKCELLWIESSQIFEFVFCRKIWYSCDSLSIVIRSLHEDIYITFLFMLI